KAHRYQHHTAKPCRKQSSLVHSQREGIDQDRDRCRVQGAARRGCEGWRPAFSDLWLVIVNGCETITCSRMFTKARAAAFAQSGPDIEGKLTVVRYLRNLALSIAFVPVFWKSLPLSLLPSRPVTARTVAGCCQLSLK